MRVFSSMVCRVVLGGMLALLIGLARPASGQQGGEGFEIPLDFRPRTYTMVSVPVELENKAFLDVLADDYGAYNISIWRLFRYNSILEQYEEFPDVDADFSRGTAVWLVNQDGRTFDIDEPFSTDDEEPVPIVVYPGWNQIGTPFPFSIACGELLDEVGELVPEIDRVERPVAFDGAEYRYNVSTCDPWTGYFVYVRADGPVPIVIPPLRTGRGAAKTSAASVDPEREYQLQLSATQAGAGLRDTQNFLGLRLAAAGGIDALDFREAPPIGAYVQLSVVAEGERFAGNFKPPVGEGQQWEIEIRATRTDHPVDVTLREQGRLPEGYRLFLLDRDFEAVVPLQDHAFQVRFGSRKPVRRFTVILGTEAYAAAQSAGIPLDPVDYALLPNYPNPFHPETQIRYRLGRRSHVVLDVYNVLGQRVRRLVDAPQEAGLHAVRWAGEDAAGRPVAGGLYLYRLRVDGFTDARPMLLMR